jgi:hypothetical protein
MIPSTIVFKLIEIRTIFNFGMLLDNLKGHSLDSRHISDFLAARYRFRLTLFSSFRSRRRDPG